jgi:hypothetical protein
MISSVSYRGKVEEALAADKMLPTQAGHNRAAQKSHRAGMLAGQFGKWVIG